MKKTRLIVFINIFWAFAFLCTLLISSCKGPNPYYHNNNRYYKNHTAIMSASLRPGPFYRAAYSRPYRPYVPHVYIKPVPPIIPIVPRPIIPGTVYVSNYPRYVSTYNVEYVDITVQEDWILLSSTPKYEVIRYNLSGAYYVHFGCLVPGICVCVDDWKEAWKNACAKRKEAKKLKEKLAECETGLEECLEDKKELEEKLKEAEAEATKYEELSSVLKKKLEETEDQLEEAKKKEEDARKRAEELQKAKADLENKNEKLEEANQRLEEEKSRVEEAFEQYKRASEEEKKVLEEKVKKAEEELAVAKRELEEAIKEKEKAEETARDLEEANKNLEEAKLALEEVNRQLEAEKEELRSQLEELKRVSEDQKKALTEKLDETQKELERLQKKYEELNRLYEEEKKRVEEAERQAQEQRKRADDEGQRADDAEQKAKDEEQRAKKAEEALKKMLVSNLCPANIRSYFDSAELKVIMDKLYSINIEDKQSFSIWFGEYKEYFAEKGIIVPAVEHQDIAKNEEYVGYVGRLYFPEGEAQITELLVSMTDKDNIVVKCNSIDQSSDDAVDLGIYARDYILLVDTFKPGEWKLLEDGNLPKETKEDSVNQIQTFGYEFAKTCQDNEMYLFIEGHTSMTSSFLYNLDLGNKRASHFYDILIAEIENQTSKLNKEKILSITYGEFNLIDDAEKDAKGRKLRIIRAKNRAVVFRCGSIEHIKEQFVYLQRMVSENIKDTDRDENKSSTNTKARWDQYCTDNIAKVDGL
ncbi:MAG: hypothetical protein ABIA04_06755 [Pseudomonadota bacterium]